MRGSSGPWGCPLTHMLALKGDREKWGMGPNPFTLNTGRLLPLSVPRRPCGLGEATPSLALPRSQPAATVTQGLSLSNWPKLAGARPAGVTPGKDRTHPLPFQVFSLGLFAPDRAWDIQ